MVARSDNYSLIFANMIISIVPPSAHCYIVSSFGSAQDFGLREASTFHSCSDKGRTDQRELCEANLFFIFHSINRFALRYYGLWTIDYGLKNKQNYQLKICLKLKYMV